MTAQSTQLSFDCLSQPVTSPVPTPDTTAAGRRRARRPSAGSAAPAPAHREITPAPSSDCAQRTAAPRVPGFLTPGDVAAQLQLPLSTVTEYCRRGLLPGAQKFGKHWRVSAAELEAYLAAAARSPRAGPRRAPRRAHGEPTGAKGSAALRRPTSSNLGGERANARNHNECKKGSQKRLQGSSTP